jgi:hypothetical protein
MANGQDRQSEITAELLKLSALQFEALKDATFLGWSPSALAAYQERGDRVVSLRSQLGEVWSEKHSIRATSALENAEVCSNPSSSSSRRTGSGDRSESD